VAQVALGVLENYLLLAGRELLEAHAPKVVEMLTSLLDALNERGTLLVFPVLDTMLQLFPQEAPALLEPPLHRALGLIVGGKHSDMVVASAACVLARVLLQNNAAFGQIMVREEDSGRGALALLFSRGRRHPDSTAPLPPRVCCRSVRLYRRMCIASVRRLSAASFCSRRPAQASAAAVPELAAAAGAEGVLDRFLDAWLDKSDALCTPKARKVTALALCTLLSMGAPQVRELGTPPPPSYLRPVILHLQCPSSCPSSPPTPCPACGCARGGGLRLVTKSTKFTRMARLLLLCCVGGRCCNVWTWWRRCAPVWYTRRMTRRRMERRCLRLDGPRT